MDQYVKSHNDYNLDKLKISVMKIQSSNTPPLTITTEMSMFIVSLTQANCNILS